jgi:hypothetical protein
MSSQTWRKHLLRICGKAFLQTTIPSLGLILFPLLFSVFFPQLLAALCYFCVFKLELHSSSSSSSSQLESKLVGHGVPPPTKRFWWSSDDWYGNELLAWVCSHPFVRLKLHTNKIKTMTNAQFTGTGGIEIPTYKRIHNHNWKLKICRLPWLWIWRTDWVSRRIWF